MNYIANKLPSVTVVLGGCNLVRLTTEGMVRNAVYMSGQELSMLVMGSELKPPCEPMQPMEGHVASP